MISSSNFSTAAALHAMGSIDFDYVVRLRDVWQDNTFDVNELHTSLRVEFQKKLEAIHRSPKAPIMGWPIIGSGGSGKTHLLGQFRRMAIANHSAFVLVDMTDVRDVWETLLQGYLDSLQQEVSPGLTQQQLLLRRFIQFLFPRQSVDHVESLLQGADSGIIREFTSKVLNHLQREHGPKTLKHQDAIRGILCLNSNDLEIQSIGYAWLQGQNIAAPVRANFAFQRSVARPVEILQSLAWYISLTGPTILAFDQLDPIVQQLAACSQPDRKFNSSGIDGEIAMSESIVKQIGGCFSAIREFDRTFPIVACIEATWNLLPEICLASFMDRFDAPRTLSNAVGKATTNIIAKRLQTGFAACNWTPPHATWPISASALEQLSNDNVRTALKKCHREVEHLRATRSCEEVHTFDRDPGDSSANQGSGNTRLPSSVIEASLLTLDHRFSELCSGEDRVPSADENLEDEQMPLLFTAMFRCWVIENQSLLSDSVDAVIESQFSGGENAKPLHARMRLIYRNEGSRELHFSVRSLERTHASAYQNRLRAAITASGIDRKLSFRNLAIVRMRPIPGGDVTRKMTEDLVVMGGKLVSAKPAEWQTLSALEQMLVENNPLLSTWLQARRPLHCLGAFVEAIVPFVAVVTPSCASGTESSASGTQSSESQENGSSDTVLDVVASPVINTCEKEEIATPNEQETLVSRPEGLQGDSTQRNWRGMQLMLGTRAATPTGPAEEVNMPLEVLAKHTLVLGGAGSGKTVTVRRLIEEAALLGIPSLVVDCAQDMCTFDEPRDEPSPFWRAGDCDRATRLRATTEMVTWTPGLLGGNPLKFEPIPDFAPLRDNPEQLNQAIELVIGAITDSVAAGKSRSAESKRGILASSMRYFAEKTEESTLSKYIQLLTELPEEAGIQVECEAKLAREMADSLRVVIAKNPQLQSNATPFDPAVLFGDDRPSSRTRISVISLIGLPSLDSQRQFLNQLAMGLFSWIKKNPHPPAGRPLRGLLVIDEARDFVPSQGASACKASLQRLVAQARKYKLGIVFATQHPKDIDNKIVGNCATHFYGRANSPVSIQTLTELMSAKGSSVADFAKLKTGQFYVHFPDGSLKVPTKIQLPDSLTAGRLLEESIVQSKADKSRLSLRFGNSG